MPFILEAKDILPEVAGFETVLIVPCRFCPAASMAVKSDEAYIEFPRRALKTASYERQISEMKEDFVQHGITTEVLKAIFSTSSFSVCGQHGGGRRCSSAPGVSTPWW